MIMSKNSKYEDECTIKSGGLFLDGQDANIVWQDIYTHMPKELEKLIKETGICFNEIKQLSPHIQEIQFVASETQGIKFKPGCPSTKCGYNLWCRIKMHTWGSWVFLKNLYHIGLVDCNISLVDYMRYIMFLPALRVALLQDFLALPQPNSDKTQNTNTHASTKSQHQIKTHSMEENLERIANSLEKIETLFKQYLDLQR